jgi:hypothetical protein
MQGKSEVVFSYTILIIIRFQNGKLLKFQNNSPENAFRTKKLTYICGCDFLENGKNFRHTVYP